MRIFNFSAGPAVLPTAVLEQVRDELLDWHGRGMSIMEMSHRGKDFSGVIEEAEADLRELMGIPANYKVLFLQGGATQQFAQIPMNLLAGGSAIDGPGTFFEPTVITDVAAGSDILREEIFGPVLAIATFADEDEAVRLAKEEKVILLRKGKPVDPDRVRGLYRIRLRAEGEPMPVYENPKSDDDLLDDDFLLDGDDEA